jgi:hypothetical protein
MTQFRANFGERAFVPVMAPWILRLAAPILLVITLPLAAFVFAIALGTAGALGAARALTRFFASAAPRPAAAGFGPVIEGEYVVVAERRRPAPFPMPR